MYASWPRSLASFSDTDQPAPGRNPSTIALLAESEKVYLEKKKPMHLRWPVVLLMASGGGLAQDNVRLCAEPQTEAECGRALLNNGNINPTHYCLVCARHAAVDIACSAPDNTTAESYWRLPCRSGTIYAGVRESTYMAWVQFPGAQVAGWINGEFRPQGCTQRSLAACGISHNFHLIYVLYLVLLLALVLLCVTVVFPNSRAMHERPDSPESCLAEMVCLLWLAGALVAGLATVVLYGWFFDEPGWQVPGPVVLAVLAGVLFLWHWFDNLGERRTVPTAAISKDDASRRRCKRTWVATLAVVASALAWIPPFWRPEIAWSWLSPLAITTGAMHVAAFGVRAAMPWSLRCALLVVVAVGCFLGSWSIQSSARRHHWVSYVGMVFAFGLTRELPTVRRSVTSTCAAVVIAAGLVAVMLERPPLLLFGLLASVGWSLGFAWGEVSQSTPPARPPAAPAAAATPAPRLVPAPKPEELAAAPVPQPPTLQLVDVDTVTL